MSFSNVLYKTTFPDRWLLVKHSKDFVEFDTIPLTLKLYDVRLVAILATLFIWVCITLLTGFFTVGLVFLLGVAIGSVHLLLRQKPHRFHLLSALFLTNLGGVVCNVFAGLALFSSKMGISYWQVLSANLSPENYQTLGGVFIQSIRPEDFAYYMLATTAVFLFAQHSYFYSLDNLRSIEVQLQNGRKYHLSPSAFNVLLSQGRIVQFKRSKGWVVFGRDPMRAKEIERGYFSSDRRS